MKQALDGLRLWAMRWSFEQKHVLGFGLIAVILIMLGVLSYWTTIEAINSNTWVAHSHQVLTRIAEIDSLVKGIDVAEQNYVRTPDVVLVKAYTKSSSSLSGFMEELRILMAGNTVQMSRLEQLRPLVQMRVELVRVGIRVRDMEGMISASNPTTLSHEQEVMEKIHKLISQLRLGETSVLEQRRLRAEDLARRALIVSFIGIPLGFAMIFLVYRLTREEVSHRRKVQDALEHARDAAVESARIKTEFLANMSHEIRTPMNGIIGMSGLLLDTPLNTEQREFASIVRTSADALLSIINDILDFSKADAGKLTLENLDFDLREVVESTTDLLAGLAHAKGVELVSLIEKGAPVHLMGDPGRLRQVLTNLINNAVKFTEKGEIVLRVSKEIETPAEAALRFSVSDTGIGIPREAHDRIFHAFAQADSSTTRKFGGTGLGLSISKRLVELMRGEMGVQSDMGKGSIFWFTARFQKPPRRTDDPPLQPKQSATSVLVADDLEASRTQLLDMLESWGMQARGVSSGDETLAALRRSASDGTPCDIAILDAEMPGWTGLALARAIRADPAIASTRIVMMTALGRRMDAVALREAGVRFQLTKPVRQSQFFDLLASVAEAAEATGEVHYQPEEGRASVMRESGATTVLRSPRVLVAEDNTANQKVALHMLQKLGCGADAVANGMEVLDALSRIPYDLVLMDCQMPEMDGYQAAAEVRRREGARKHTAIVAMTAHAMQGEREKCLAAGMDDYLTKPIQERELAAIIARWGAAAHGGVS